MLFQELDLQLNSTESANSDQVQDLDSRLASVHIASTGSDGSDDVSSMEYSAGSNQKQHAKDEGSAVITEHDVDEETPNSSDSHGSGEARSYEEQSIDPSLLGEDCASFASPQDVMGINQW